MAPIFFAIALEIIDWLQPVSGKQLTSKGARAEEEEGAASHKGSCGVGMLCEPPYIAYTGLAEAGWPESYVRASCESCWVVLSC